MSTPNEHIEAGFEPPGCTPTPPQTDEAIAKEAAEQICGIDPAYKSRAILSDRYAAIILQSARRIAAQERERLLQMVRDSGAVEALKLARLHTPSEEDYIIDAALDKLRAITQPKKTK
jgi:hypothetical protein